MAQAKSAAASFACATFVWEARSLRSLYTLYALFFMLIWLLLTKSLVISELLFGIGLSLLIAHFFVRTALHYTGERQPLKDLELALAAPKVLVMLLLFIPYFVVEVLLSAVQVAGAVIRPQTVRPGIIGYRTQLTHPFLVSILANLITLTPGTMTLDYDQNSGMLFVHFLSLGSTTSRSDATRGIQRLENWVRRIFA